MKIYRNLTITNSYNIPEGTKPYPFKIDGVNLFENAHMGRDVLLLNFGRYKGKGKNKRKTMIGLYTLVGEIYEEFLKDMEIKDGRIEKLVGKKVVGFTKDNSNVIDLADYIQGLMIVKY